MSIGRVIVTDSPGHQNFQNSWRCLHGYACILIFSDDLGERIRTGVSSSAVEAVAGTFAGRGRESEYTHHVMHHHITNGLPPATAVNRRPTHFTHRSIQREAHGVTGSHELAARGIERFTNQRFPQ